MRYIVQPKLKGAKINKNIYGQFSEHLGRCIYGGLFVGKDSKIENVRGIRSDVVDALKKMGIPNLRWPGGCFADEYHWRDGIGEPSSRKKMINTNWGGVTEDNSFGTHEFLDLCEQLGCEPYINLNVGSGTVQEMEEWVEYMTSANVSPMTALREKNGRKEPWNVKFLGIGNENWGCGGNMRPEYYADEYRRYQTFVHQYGAEKPFKIACGAGTGFKGPNLEWTHSLMKNAGKMMDGLSLHYYTVPGASWEHKGSATDFDEDTYYRTLVFAQYIDELLAKQDAAMSEYDPEKRVWIILDEWGTWFDVEPGTNPGFLFQQNTMRDALVAGITMNAMQHHADRLKMANIAQLVNVLQSPILTEGEKMVLTPTYHAFEMYQKHQENTLLGSLLETASVDTPDGKLPVVSETASEDKDGNIVITLTNASAKDAANISLRIDGEKYEFASGRLLTGDIHDKNTFDEKNAVAPKAFKAVKTLCADDNGTEAELTLPSCSLAELLFKRA